ncbi:hypothetical protein ABG067_007799, partial [Albugo candida]
MSPQSAFSKAKIFSKCPSCEKRFPVNRDFKNHTRTCAAQKAIVLEQQSFEVPDNDFGDDSYSYGAVEETEEAIDINEEFNENNDAIVQNVESSEFAHHDDSIVDILRNIPENTTEISAKTAIALRIYYRYLSTTMTVQECISSFEDIKFTLQRYKSEELKNNFEKQRKEGKLSQDWTPEKIQEYIDEKVAKIEVSTYNRAATTVTKLTKDFVKVTIFKACYFGCTLFKLSDPEDTPCKFCEADLLNPNKKKKASSSESPEDYLEKMRLLTIKKQIVYYVNLKEQLISLFINDDMREELKYGMNYTTRDGVYGDVFDGEVIKSVIDCNNDGMQVSLTNYVIYVGVMQDGNSAKFQTHISPGPNKPKMSTYMRPLAEELKELEQGFTVK